MEESVKNNRSRIVSFDYTNDGDDDGINVNIVISLPDLQSAMDLFYMLSVETGEVVPPEGALTAEPETEAAPQPAASSEPEPRKTRKPRQPRSTTTELVVPENRPDYVPPASTPATLPAPPVTVVEAPAPVVVPAPQAPPPPPPAPPQAPEIVTALPEKLTTAEKIKDVVVYLRDSKMATTTEAVIAWCIANYTAVPALKKRYADSGTLDRAALEDSLTRACTILFAPAG